MSEFDDARHTFEIGFQSDERTIRELVALVAQMALKGAVSVLRITEDGEELSQDAILRLSRERIRYRAGMVDTVRDPESGVLIDVIDLERMRQHADRSNGAFSTRLATIAFHALVRNAGNLIGQKPAAMRQYIYRRVGESPAIRALALPELVECLESEHEQIRNLGAESLRFLRDYADHMVLPESPEQTMQE